MGNVHRKVRFSRKLLLARGLGFNGNLWPLSMARLVAPQDLRWPCSRYPNRPPLVALFTQRCSSSAGGADRWLLTLTHAHAASQLSRPLPFTSARRAPSRKASKSGVSVVRLQRAALPRRSASARTSARWRACERASAEN